jgi:uncharacterized membrane protein
MTQGEHEMQAPRHSIVLTAHRSLSATGFTVLMALLGAVSFVTGIVFVSIGAWPVFAFFGLDVLIVYVAFRLNYRAGRVHEIIEISPAAMTLTRVAPSGRREVFPFNPYWTRVALDQAVDGRTTIALTSHGRAFTFGRFLNDEERRELAPVLSDALADVRGVKGGA